MHALYEMDSVIRDLMTKGNPNPRIQTKYEGAIIQIKVTLFSLQSLHTCRSHTDAGPIRQSPHLDLVMEAVTRVSPTLEAEWQCSADSDLRD